MSQATSLELSQPEEKEAGWWKRGPVARFFAKKLNLIAFILLLFITLVTVGADVIAGGLLNQTRDTIDLPLVAKMVDAGKGQPPYPPGTGGHILGTDGIARDELARLIYAGQVSLCVGYLTALISVLVGGGFGILSGYYGRWVDNLIGAVMQILVNLPIFFMMIMLSFIIHFEILSISLIIGLLSWVGMARLVRGQVLSIKTREYIEAARAIGARPLWIMLRHIAPNIFPTMLVMIGFDVGAAIITEAALSYLQFGVQIPVPSWGNQISGSDASSPRLTGISADWLFWPPIICMAVTLLAIYIVANGLRDAFDIE